MTLFRHPLSNPAEVLDRSDGDTVRPVKASLHMVEQSGGGGREGVQVGPPTVTTELVLQMPPNAFNQVQLGSLGGKPQRAEAVDHGDPPAPDRVALRVANVGEHYYDLAGGKCVG
jgi:hypothetical protein